VRNPGALGLGVDGAPAISGLDVGDLEHREPASGVKFHPGATDYSQLESAEVNDFPVMPLAFNKRIIIHGLSSNNECRDDELFY